MNLSTQTENSVLLSSHFIQCQCEIKDEDGVGLIVKPHSPNLQLVGL